jgi:hypothetical protein
MFLLYIKFMYVCNVISTVQPKLKLSYSVEYESVTMFCMIDCMLPCIFNVK